MFIDTYFEPTAGGITFPIGTDPDGSGLMVGFEPRGHRGGYCTVLSTGATTPSYTIPSQAPTGRITSRSTSAAG